MGITQPPEVSLNTFFFLYISIQWKAYLGTIQKTLFHIFSSKKSQIFFLNFFFLLY